MKIKNKIKQKGATLVTSMMLLIVMTIAGVTTIKISSTSLLIAGAQQEGMLLSQHLNSELPMFASVEYLQESFTSTGFTPTSGQSNKYIFNQVEDEDIRINKTITNHDYKYGCLRNGKASDIGPDAPVCDLYDFYIDLYSTRSNAKDTRHQGSGKMVPSKEHSADSTRGVYNFVN